MLYVYICMCVCVRHVSLRMGTLFHDFTIKIKKPNFQNVTAPWRRWRKAPTSPPCQTWANTRGSLCRSGRCTCGTDVTAGNKS